MLLNRYQRRNNPAAYAARRTYDAPIGPK